MAPGADVIRRRKSRTIACQTARPLVALLPAMMPLNLPFCFIARTLRGCGRSHGTRRGPYRRGAAIRRIVDNWGDLKRELIRDVDQNLACLRRWALSHSALQTAATGRLGIIRTWPRTETGLLALDDDTFLQQAARHPELPQLQTLRELARP